VEERPAWLGAAFDYYTAPPLSNYCNKSAVEIRGQGQTQGRSQGRSCEYQGWKNLGFLKKVFRFLGFLKGFLGF